MLEVSMIASIAGELAGGRLSRRRPFRAPHHSASMAALAGGGLRAQPGEMALAHNGVLFLDELPEFQSRALEALRQPLESGQTVVARANHHVTYPARFQLVAAMNPCKCGLAGEPGHVCRRGPRCSSEYQGRISGPLIDRIDLQIELAAVKVSDLTLPPPREGSAEVAARVAAAAPASSAASPPSAFGMVRTNSQADGQLLEEIARPEEPGLALLREAAEAMRLTAAGLSPGAAGGAYACRSGGPRPGRAHAHRRGLELSPAPRRLPGRRLKRPHQGQRGQRRQRQRPDPQRMRPLRPCRAWACARSSVVSRSSRMPPRSAMAPSIWAARCASTRTSGRAPITRPSVAAPCAASSMRPGAPAAPRSSCAPPARPQPTC
jgi:hypothetical protein